MRPHVVIAELVRHEAYLDALADSLDGAAPPPLLRCAKIKLTSRCNLRCVMCKYWQTTREETLASDRWREVFGELVALGCRKVHFSGGEVFLRRDFLDLVQRLNEGLRGNELAVAKTGEQPQPVFSLVRKDVLANLEAFLRSGGRKIDAWYAGLRTVEVSFDDEADAFRNINTLEELGKA